MQVHVIENRTIRCRCINPEKTVPHLTDYTPSYKLTLLSSVKLLALKSIGSFVEDGIINVFFIKICTSIISFEDAINK